MSFKRIARTKSTNLLRTESTESESSQCVDLLFLWGTFTFLKDKEILRSERDLRGAETMGVKTRLNQQASKRDPKVLTLMMFLR